MGGIGEYFSIDPVIIRVLALILIVATEVVPGILIYILGVFIVPLQPEHHSGLIRDAETTEEPKE